jgi:alpha-beta hydrolase superfamily lysophospholipase
VKTLDGVVVHGSFWKGGEAHAPAVVLAHRLGGDRTEWTPLIERLFPTHKPMNVVALDLRGHGQSTTRKGKPGKVLWQSLETDDFARMDSDVAGVIAWLVKKEGGPPSRLILVGSDIGATAITRAAKESSIPVVAAALISPGASLRGVDLYEPFAAVLALPNLIMAADADNVSSEPAKSLGAMSKSSTVLRFDGNAHGAEALGGQHWEAWDSLADWVEARAAVPDAIAPPAMPDAIAPPATTLAK